MRRYLHPLIVLLLTAFALLTLFLSSSIIFDLFGLRAREGNYVPLVVWANFLCSLIYLVAAYGIYRKKKWAVRLLTIAAGILIVAFIGLLVHVRAGGLYETKTLFALPFRTIVTLLFAAGAYWITKNEKRLREGNK